MGLPAAITSAISGLLVSTVVNEFAWSLGPQGLYIVVLFHILSIAASIELIDKMNHWSISYTISWLAGLLLVGRHLMEPWEVILYAIVSIVFMILKIVRKIRNY